MIEDKRIKRKVERINEKIRENYPLFYDQFKTDYETEKKRKEDHKIDAEVHWNWMQDKDDLRWFKIEFYKRILLHLGREDVIKESYRYFYDFHNQQTCYLADSLCGGIAKEVGIMPYQVQNYCRENFNYINIPY